VAVATARNRTSPTGSNIFDRVHGTVDKELREENYPVAKIYAENIGGIQETSVEFSPGVTILEGRNATNRTSFLQSVMAALGSENVAIKGDADEVKVELTPGDETYTRTLYRHGAGRLHRRRALPRRLDDRLNASRVLRSIQRSR
jgi:hypothetical protein